MSAELNRPETAAGLRRDRPAVLRIGDVLHPLYMNPVERLLHGDVHHRTGRASAVPVLLAGRNPHHVTGTDFADRTAPGLHAAEARHHQEGLAERMGVPCGTRARLETHPRRPDARWLRRLDDRILPHRAGEPVARTTARRH